MKKITNEEFLSRITRDNETYNEHYLKLYSLYHLLLTKYVKKIFSLQQIDDSFSNSELNYLAVNEDKMDIYQWLSSEELKYFYIRNNLYLKRLNEEEIKFLETKLNNEELDEETEQFITNTIEKVVSEQINAQHNMTFYGPMNGNFMAPANSLVIGFRYDEFNTNGLTDDEWDIMHEKQISDQFSKLIQLKSQVSRFNIIPVRIIEYSDFSIRKKKQVNNFTR